MSEPAAASQSSIPTGARRRSRARRAVAAVVMIGLAACTALMPNIDGGATAPALDGYGEQTLTSGSSSASAEAKFQRGVAQAYAFNEVEAVRMFKAALATDPHCAMCAWGIAWQLGPNINAPERGDPSEARGYVQLALVTAWGTKGRQRALIESLALRYGQAAVPADMAPALAEVCGRPKNKRADPLDIAYAERLYALVLRTPEDPDLLSLWAEAEMIRTRDDWWSAAGRPAGRIGEVADRLQAALAAHPEHTGLNHYLIHALDSAGPEAWRALPAADRLALLAPLSPHLVHMPAHIHVRVGRYADATRENQRALELDDLLDATLRAQGFASSKDWRGHNLSFAWFAALMEGRGGLALDLARQRAARAKGDNAFAEYGRSVPLLTLQRLERWSQLLDEPRPIGDKGLAAALGGQARGVALLRLGRLDEARAEWMTVDAGATMVEAAHASDEDDEDRLLRGMARWARYTLQAEIALAESRAADALAVQAQAREAARPAEETEPPLLGAVSALALGDMQRRAGQAAAAEQTFRAELVVWPDNGWALSGLRRALAAQGQSAQAAQLEVRIEQDWPAADRNLR